MFPRQQAERSGPLVLVVSDEPRATAVLSVTLADEGFDVRTCGYRDGLPGLIADEGPDLVLLVGETDGLEEMELLDGSGRAERPPVILLSGSGSVPDIVGALARGADDYVRKPFNVDELAARIRAVIRRRGMRDSEAGTGRIRVGPLEIDAERRLMFRNGHPVVLSRMEWLLLRRLAQTPGSVVVYEDLLDALWGPGFREEVQLLRVCVSRLRQKLGSRGQRDTPIRTYVGIGYALQAEPLAGKGRGRRSRRRGTGAQAGDADPPTERFAAQGSVSPAPS